MAREVPVAQPSLDQFPAFEDDGYSKRSGLTPSDFTVTVFYNASPLAMAVSIEEIGDTGEYRLSFSPPGPGLYEIQVLIHFNKEIWAGVYEAKSPTSYEVIQGTKGQVDKIDLVQTLGPAEVADGSLMDRMLNADEAKTYNQATDSQQGIRRRMG